MTFQIEAFQNRHLAPGQDRVDAILSVAAGSMGAAAAAPRELLMGFIVDTSGSMAGGRINAVRYAVESAINLLNDDDTFFVVAFQHEAQVVCEPRPATPENKRAAAQRLERLRSSGGTAMSTGLAMARALFARSPDSIREAVFLTDGKNESEQPGRVTEELARCTGMFECACWGVGTDWQVGEVQEIAHALMGKASLIPDGGAIEAAFGEAVQRAQSKAVKDVRVRLWTPIGAEVAVFKQVSPTLDDLFSRATVISPQVREFSTGAWGDGEERDFQVAVRVAAGQVGDEMLAARPSIVYQIAGPNGWVEQEDRAPEARLFASWTMDDALTSRLDQHVAHYTGQGELAQAIQEGLEKREQGDEAAATQLLGRAVQIAHQSENADMTARLRKVVDVVDPSVGTVRLKRTVAKEAQMDLQLESTTTKRLRKG